MNISGVSEGSSLWAIQKLFARVQETGQEMPGAGQKSAGASAPPMQGFAGPQMSSDMMQTFCDIQEQSGSDMASRLMSALDTDGDGNLSLEEATSADDADASKAFGALDADGDGALTLSELSTALESAGGPPPGGAPPGGPPPGGPPPGGAQGASAEDDASKLVDALDTNGDGTVSLDEMLAQFGDEESEAATKAFATLDSDGDNAVSLQELTSAVSAYAQATRGERQGAMLQSA